MTNECYTNLESQFCADHDRKIRDYLKLRYSEFKENIRKERSFKEFLDHYLRPPIFIAVIALAAVCKDLLSLKTFLTIIVSEAVILGWLWVVWKDETAERTTHLFGNYECLKAVQEYLWAQRTVALQSAEDMAQYAELDAFFTIAMRELPYRYSTLFYHNKL